MSNNQKNHPPLEMMLASRVVSSMSSESRGMFVIGALGAALMTGDIANVEKSIDEPAANFQTVDGSLDKEKFRGLVKAVLALKSIYQKTYDLTSDLEEKEISFSSLGR